MASKREQTHERMLEAASQGFRHHGFAGIGVDAIAKAAGATSGAFYAHLTSKDKAFDAALERGLEEVLHTIPEYQAEHGAGWVRAFAEFYLSRAHRDDLPCGCAMTTLSPEVARARPEVHAAYQKKMAKIVSVVADGLADGPEEARRSRAWALLSTLIGGLTVARAVKTRKVAEEIAAAITAAAITAAGPTRQLGQPG